MIFKEYQEFVVYPLQADKVRHREDRLNIEHGFRINCAGAYPQDYSPSSEKGAVVPLQHIVLEHDQFEAMQVSDSGHVTIWTRDRVWFLVHEGNDQQIERMKYVPRNPRDD